MQFLLRALLEKNLKGIERFFVSFGFEHRSNLVLCLKEDSWFKLV